jgi:hypothetical protein
MGDAGSLAGQLKMLIAQQSQAPATSTPQRTRPPLNAQSAPTDRHPRASTTSGFADDRIAQRVASRLHALDEQDPAIERVQRCQKTIDLLVWGWCAGHEHLHLL